MEKRRQIPHSADFVRNDSRVAEQGNTARLKSCPPELREFSHLL
jgi:hypothetical protein